MVHRNEAITWRKLLETALVCAQSRQCGVGDFNVLARTAGAYPDATDQHVVNINWQTSRKTGDRTICRRGNQSADFLGDVLAWLANGRRCSGLGSGALQAQEFCAIHAELREGFAAGVHNDDALRLTEFICLGNGGLKHRKRRAMGQAKCRGNHHETAPIGETPFTLR